jgi:hypothetical protein
MNFIVSLGIWKHNILVSVEETDAQFRKTVIRKYGTELFETMKHINYEFDDRTRNGVTVHNVDSGHTLLRIKERPTTPRTIGTLAHEIYHATEYILDRVGVSRTESESWAYTIGYITEQIYHKLK